MTLYEFNALDQQSKYDEVLNLSGLYLDNYINGNQRFNLYAIDKFFVEVEYNAETNRLVKIKGFTTGKLLDKYTNFTGC
jgi:hypothetical protein